MVSRRAVAVLATIWVGVPVAFARGVRAHGGVVETPPVPVAFVVVGAALSVAATALALAVGPDPPTGRVPLVSVPAGALRWGRRCVRVVVVAVLVAAVASTAGGDAGVPFAVVVLWPVLLKGSLVVAAVVGSPWRVVSPWEMAYDAVVSLEGEPVSRWAYPERLGSWPAVVGLLAMVGVVENLTVVPGSARLAVAVLASYALLSFFGALAFGREWFERADAFTVLYRLVGRVAPVAVTRDRARDDEVAGCDDCEVGRRVLVSLRPPWTASARPLADRGLGAFVVVALATVTFDGAVETVAAVAVTQRLATVVGPFAGVVLYAVVVLAFLAAAALAARAVAGAAGRHPNVGEVVERDGGDSLERDGGDSLERDGGGASRSTVDGGGASRSTVDGGVHEYPLGSRLAATLLPIAVAYDVAHNYAYVLVNATRALERALEFVGVSVGLDPTPLLAPTGVWTFQVTLVLFGHVVAVVAAHVATTRAFPDAASARRGHAPLAALMVAYTVASLYVLAAP